MAARLLKGICRNHIVQELNERSLEAFKTRPGFDEMITVRADALPYGRWLVQKLSAPASPLSLLAALQPFTVAYVTYLALRYNTYDYLLLAFSAFLAFLLLNISADRSQKPIAKLRAGFISLPIFGAYIIDGLITSLISPFYIIKKRFNFKPRRDFRDEPGLN